MYMYYVCYIRNTVYIILHCCMCVYMQVKPVTVIAKSPRSDIQFSTNLCPVSEVWW